MNFYSFGPIAAVLDAAYSFVTSLVALTQPFVGALATALATALVTVIVRAVLLPLGVALVRSEYTRRRIAPKLAALQQKYKKKPELLTQKTMELYREEKSSPFAGMAPALLQAPVVSIVYGLFILNEINGHENALLGADLFGAKLGDSLFAAVGGGADPGAIAVYLGVLVVIAVTSWFTRVTALRFAASAPRFEGAPEMPPAMARTMGAMSWMPFITVIFAAVVPLAAALYLAVSTAWTLAERTILRRMLSPRDY